MIGRQADGDPVSPRLAMLAASATGIQPPVRWSSIRSFGIQPRGLVLIALLVIPMFAITVQANAAARANARANARERALTAAVLGAREYRHRVNAAEQLLTAGAPYAGGPVAVPTSMDGGRCNRTLADLMRQNPGYLNLFISDLKGDLVCSALPLASPVNIADRDYFQAVLSTRQPSVGAPVIGRVSNRPSAIVGYPILGPGGEPLGVAGASLDLDSIVRLPAEVGLSADTAVSIVDRRGIVLARNIDPDGTIGSPGPQLRGVRDPAEGNGTSAEGVGTNGIPRLFGVVPLRPFPGAAAQGALYVGIPTSEAYGRADVDFTRQIGWLVATSLAACLLAWFGSQRLLVMPLRRIAGATQRIARGDFATRTGIRASGEIGILASSVDHMAAALATVHADLERERHEMASVLSSGPSVVALVDVQGRVLRVNDALERTFGYPTAEFVGRNIHELFDDLVVPGGWGDPALRPFESIGHRRDESTLPIEVVIRPVEGSAPPRYVVVIRDVTERKRAEADRELAQIAETRLDFLRTVNHELRAPLTTVLEGGEALRADLADPRLRGQADAIVHAGGRMLAIVDDLLDLSRIDAGRWETITERFDAVELIHRVVETFEAAAAAKGLRLVADLPEGPLPMDSDARALREVLTNLIENAVKFTEHGGVAVHAERRDGELEIEVRDTGIGIAREHVDAVFEPFVQVHPQPEGEPRVGSGLGLAIARRLVSMLRGEIAVASTLRGGTVFTVRVPLGGR